MLTFLIKPTSSYRTIPILFSPITQTTAHNRHYASSTPSKTSNSRDVVPPPSSNPYLSSRSKDPPITWFPGHISSALKQLEKTLTSCDVILEVLDARIPFATSHPLVGVWSKGRPRVVVMNKVDLLPIGKKGKDLIHSWRREDLISDVSTTSSGENNLKNMIYQRETERLKYSTNSDTNLHKAVLERLQNQTKDEYEPSLETVIDNIIPFNAQLGTNLSLLKNAILSSGSHINQKRLSKGLQPRPLRVAVIGFPNVGKSAVINRILGRKRRESYDLPGVTRSLQWVKVNSKDLEILNRANKKKGGTPNSKLKNGSGDENYNSFELLDTPGVIPPSLINQHHANLIAIFNAIGEGGYNKVNVAGYLLDLLLYIFDTPIPSTNSNCNDDSGRKTKTMGELMCPSYPTYFLKRYKAEFPTLSNKHRLSEESPHLYDKVTGEDLLSTVSSNCCHGDDNNAAVKVLMDFRSGRMGGVSLQVGGDFWGDCLRGKNGGGSDLRGEIEEEEEVVIEDIIDEDGDDGVEFNEEYRRRINETMELIREKGVVLPKSVKGFASSSSDSAIDLDENENEIKEEEEKAIVKMNKCIGANVVGKGKFDGW